MTKIDVVSGFLGAGKTTLIKKLLSEALNGTNTVLIENEFGIIVDPDVEACEEMVECQVDFGVVGIFCKTVDHARVGEVELAGCQQDGGLRY